MLFFKSALTLSSLLVLASAATLERSINTEQEFAILPVTPGMKGNMRVPSTWAAKSDCAKEDEDDCKEFCSMSKATSTCKADGSKITCYCTGGGGGGGGDAKCEERCLFCVPDKSAMTEARRIFNL